MTFSRRLLLICAVLVGAAGMAHAGSGGSTYSVLGLGDLRYLPGARSTGMGYTGIGVVNSLYINPTAPATWTRIAHTRIDASMLYEGFNTTDGNTSRYLSSMNFAGALMAIPIAPADGIVLVAGFTPYSSVDFNLATSGTYQSGTDQINYTLRHVGSGSLGQAELGTSWSPAEQWSLGASLNYVFGTIDKSTSMITSQTSIATGVSRESAHVHGVLANVGVIYSGFGGALRPLSIGFSATTSGVLNSSRQKEYVYSGGGQSTTAYDTLSLPEGDISVPVALGFGLSWTLSDRLLFAADYRMQAWGNSDFYGETPAGIRNSQMVGVGFERASSRDASASFWSHVAYRLGFMYNATYYEVKGTPINEWTGTAGISIPVSGDTRLNFSGEYGIRGKKSSALVKDTIIRFTASLTLGEAWFVRPEEE